MCYFFRLNQIFKQNVINRIVLCLQTQYVILLILILDKYNIYSFDRVVMR